MPVVLYAQYGCFARGTDGAFARITVVQFSPFEALAGTFFHENRRLGYTLAGTFSKIEELVRYFSRVSYTYLLLGYRRHC